MSSASQCLFGMGYGTFRVDEWGTAMSATTVCACVCSILRPQCLDESQSFHAARYCRFVDQGVNGSAHQPNARVRGGVGNVHAIARGNNKCIARLQTQVVRRVGFDTAVDILGISNREHGGAVRGLENGKDLHPLGLQTKVVQSLGWDPDALDYNVWNAGIARKFRGFEAMPASRLFRSMFTPRDDR